MKFWCSCIVLCGLAGVAHCQVQGEVVASGFNKPLSTIQSPIASNTIFVVEKGGAIRKVTGGIVAPTPYLTLTGIATDSERGLLGLAFSPTFTKDHFGYVSFTKANGDLTIARFTQNTAGDSLDLATELDLISIPHKNGEHNGGTLRFGPDRMLYIGTGDGVQTRNAQSPTSLLGKMLRIDPRKDSFPTDPNRNYRIPADNPFAGQDPLNALGEIWDFGLRNPWKFHFDDPARGGTGDLIIADVGASMVDELDYERAGQGGKNYGWIPFEGTHPTGQGTLSFADTKPTYEIDRTITHSVTGGYIYRGTALPSSFYGQYFFADFVKGRLFSLAIDTTAEPVVPGALTEYTDFTSIGGLGSIASIDPDANGEILITDYAGGRVIRIVRTPAAK